MVVFKVFFNRLSCEFFDKKQNVTTVLDQVNFQFGSDFNDEQILDHCILKQSKSSWNLISAIL